MIFGQRKSPAGTPRGHQSPEALLSLRIRSTSKLHRTQGPRKTHQTGLAKQCQLQRGDVAVADHDLGIPPDGRIVDSIEQSRSTIASPQSHDRPNARIAEHSVEIGQPLFIGTRESSVVPQSVGADFNAVPLSLQVADTAFYSLRPPQGPGRGHQTHDVTASQRPWTQDAFHFRARTKRSTYLPSMSASRLTTSPTSLSLSAVTS